MPEEKAHPQGEAGPPILERGRVQEVAREVGRLLEEGQGERALELFHRLHPADQAEVLHTLARGSQRALLQAVAPAELAQALENLEPEEAAQALQGLDTATVSRVLEETSPDVAADILKRLPEERFREALSSMRDAREVAPLLHYADDTAGGLMVPDYPVVRADLTVGTALDRLRLLGPRAEDIGTLFVVDEEGRLVGSVSVVRLALARPHERIADIMNREVISVRDGVDQEECAHLIERYNLNQLPVVDGEGRLVGVILAEDAVDVLEEEALEDMYKLAGVHGERLFGPLGASVWRRLPWLYINLATAFLAAWVISLFESTIARAVALAAFLPVVAGEGGIGGTQTLTLVVRGMAVGEVTGLRALRLLLREVALGLVHGVLVGLVVAVIAYLWKGKPALGLVLGLAMIGNMLVAGLTGAGVPLALRRLGIDPAVASPVVVTTFTDVMGFLLYLGLATLLIHYLL